MSKEQWFVATGAPQPIGPVSRQVIERGLVMGVIPKTSLVARAGDEHWVPVEELFAPVGFSPSEPQLIDEEVRTHFLGSSASSEDSQPQLIDEEAQTRFTAVPPPSQQLRPASPPPPASPIQVFPQPQPRATPSPTPHQSPRPPAFPTRQVLQVVAALVATGGAALVFVLVLLPALSGAWRHRGSGAPSASVSATPPPPLQLPVASLAAVQVGVPLEDLLKQFPAAEPVQSCKPLFVGGDPPSPTMLPGAEKKPHALCARAGDIAGLLDGEVAKIVSIVADEPREVALDKIEGMIYVVAQVRGAVRAGAIANEQLLEVTKGRLSTPYRAALLAAAELFDGAYTFVRPRSARRPIAAVIRDDCSDLDGERVRAYVHGEYSLGQLDQAALTRVAGGKCRGAYVQNEGSLQRKFVSRTGAFAGIGLTRASRSDRKLDPNAPPSFQVYSSRSKLSPQAARLGVLLANALPEVERFWAGAIALRAQGTEPWGNALVWLEQGKVSRVLLNVAEEAKLEGLTDALRGVYGEQGQAQGLRVSWSRADTTSTLDLGATLGLWLGYRQGGPSADRAAPVSSQR